MLRGLFILSAIVLCQYSIETEAVSEAVSSCDPSKLKIALSSVTGKAFYTSCSNYAKYDFTNPVPLPDKTAADMCYLGSCTTMIKAMLGLSFEDCAIDESTNFKRDVIVKVATKCRISPPKVTSKPTPKPATTAPPTPKPTKKLENGCSSSKLKSTFSSITDKDYYKKCEASSKYDFTNPRPLKTFFDFTFCYNADCLKLIPELMKVEVEECAVTETLFFKKDILQRIFKKCGFDKPKITKAPTPAPALTRKQTTAPTIAPADVVPPGGPVVANACESSKLKVAFGSLIGSSDYVSCATNFVQFDFLNPTPISKKLANKFCYFAPCSNLMKGILYAKFEECSVGGTHNFNRDVLQVIATECGYSGSKPQTPRPSSTKQVTDVPDPSGTVDPNPVENACSSSKLKTTFSSITDKDYYKKCQIRSGYDFTNPTSLKMFFNLSFCYNDDCLKLIPEIMKIEVEECAVTESLLFKKDILNRIFQKCGFATPDRTETPTPSLTPSSSSTEIPSSTPALTPSSSSKQTPSRKPQLSLTNAPGKTSKPSTSSPAETRKNPAPSNAGDVSMCLFLYLTCFYGLLVLNF